MKNAMEVIAVVGSPNAGKTTLFNWLTNRKYKTVNYPGATVEYSIATLAHQFGGDFIIMDTPGTYSLIPKSEDEEVTFKALFNHEEFGKIKKVIVVADGTQLARHLFLVSQLKSCGFHVVIAITMSDLIKKSGQTINTKIIEEAFSCSVVLIDGLLGGGVKSLIEALRKDSYEQESNLKTTDSTQLKISKEEQLELIEKLNLVAKNALSFDDRSPSFSKEKIQLNKNKLLSNTKKWDRWLLHPTLGLVFFIAIMGALFSAIFYFATPFMDFIDGVFASLASDVAKWGGESLWADFLGNGVVASFGAVLVFVPQIFILFLLIGFLESTGYLARAATLIDRPLAFFGMSGRSFVPILSGFACAVPAIMATRNISSKRNKFITLMIIPLMTCSARLPVYSLLLAFLFKDRPAWQAGLGLTALYFGGLLVGSVVSQVLHRFLKSEKNAFFMMELPLYRQPKLMVVLKQAWTKTLGYLKRAGPPIFTFALLVWVATTFPNYKAESDHIRLETSYAGRFGKYIEPIFKPMGVEWRVGVSLISAFAAREVFASSLAVIFNVTGDNEESLRSGLLSSMAEAKDSSGQLIFTTGSVLGLLVFVMIALQCTSTTAIVIRETGKISWALYQLIGYNLLAYILAIGINHLWN